MKLDHISEEYAIYGMLFSLCNRIQTMGDKEFDDITMKQHFLMIAIEMFEEPPTLTEVGPLIGCSYQNVKRMATHLQEAGYLNMVQDDSDRRKVLLVSTGKIEKEADQNRDRTDEFMQQLYKGIDQDDLVKTLEILKVMDKNIGGVIE